MAEDWDLFAIVRSCQSATNTATTTSTISTQDTSSSPLATSTVKEEYDSFSFPDLDLVQPIINEFQELNQLFTSLNPTNNTTPTGVVGINPDFPSSDFSGSIQESQQSEHLPVLAPTITTTHTSVGPHFVPEASASGLNRAHGHQLQQVVQKEESLIVPQSSSAIVLPNTQRQTPRTRKRKSQQKRMVCHVTADNLSTDLWTWRKYGQKPIKGSPHPRNYYRCSSSKGCAARKQVERSNTEADMYIITYTGDHAHPRPTHRNSLAGSTRTKSTTTHPPPGGTHRSSSGSLSIPPENDLAEEQIETESPDPETEPDVEAEGDVDIFPPTPGGLVSFLRRRSS